MKIKTLICNPFAENCYVVIDEKTRECAIIDCGCYDYNEQAALREFIAKENLTVKFLLNTHLHIDHAFGNAFVAREFGVLPLACKEDEFLLDKMNDQAIAFGVSPCDGAQKLGGYLTENDRVNFGEIEFEILHVPGHSPGSLCFYSRKEKVVFTGDVLFFQSIGRTDLPGGNHEQLVSGIAEKLFTLPDEVEVFPGHGRTSTIGFERAHNPYF